MKKIKKPIAFLLCIAMLISAFSGCGKEKNSQEALANPSEESITRGEWLDLLASNFGAVNSTTEEPYFSNITKENDMFAKIQTLVEFGVIDKSEKLNLDSYVTYKEIALNTLALLGTDIIADYLETTAPPKEKDLLKLAEDKKIVSKTSNAYATRGEAQTALDTAVDLYVNRPIIEKQDTKLKSGVKDIRKNDASYENGNVTINDETKVSVDDIIILPATDEYPTGLARKVTAVNGNVLTTTEPELSEVYEKIDISSTVVPKLSDIRPAADGITIEEYSDIEGLSNNNAETKLITLSNNADIMPLAKKNKGISFSIPINFTKEKLTIDAKWNALTLEMGKQNTKLDTESVPFAYDKDGNQYTQKYTGGFEIKGKISIENLRFDVDVDWSASDLIKSVSISPKFTVKVDLGFKGKAEGEELTVFKTAVPIGATGAGVDCLFVIKVGINGDITVKTKMVTESCTTYTKGKGITTAATEADFDNSLQISGNLTVGVGPKAVLTILGIDIADVALLLGLGAKGTLKATPGSAELPCVDVKAYGPTVLLTIGKDKKTLLNKLGVAVEIKIVDLENALLKPIWGTTYHWESNNGWMKSSECTGNKKTGENRNEIDSTSPSNSNCTGSLNNTDNSSSQSGSKAKISITVSDIPYKSLSHVRNGVLVVQNKNGKYGMLNTSGKVLVDFQFDYYQLANDGYVLFDFTKLYNPNGKCIISNDYLISNYSNGILCIESTKSNDHHYGYRTWDYITLSFEKIFTFEQSLQGDDGQGMFNNNGVAVLCSNIELEEDIKVINKNGKIIYEHSCYNGAHCIYSTQIGTDGWIPLWSPINANCMTLVNYLTKSTRDLSLWDKYGVNSTEIDICYIASDEEDFVLTDGDLIVLKANDICHLYDIKKDKEIASYPSITLNKNSKHNLIESKDGKWGYIDRSGNVKKLYEDATNFYAGYAMVKIDGKLYVIDENFNVVSDGVEGDGASALSDNYFSIKRGENYYLASFK